MFDARLAPSASPVTAQTVGEFLRCSMGLSAWKQFGAARWALRVNPSSGNLHPTECYVVWAGKVAHYAPREHALETRCVFEPPSADDGFLVALTSIHWREAWKYGERAFRYCQHDVGHAIGALRFAASLLGWRFELLDGWRHADLASLLGLDRAADFIDAEREDPDVLAHVARTGDTPEGAHPNPWLAAVRGGTWTGRANPLSPTRVPWPIIDQVVASTVFPGTVPDVRDTGPTVPPHVSSPAPAAAPARELILRRRSAVAFDGRSSLPKHDFIGMLTRLQPTGPPWDALPWAPQVNLALFVHRVDGLTPGLYTWVRTGRLGDWRGALRAGFLWERIESASPLWLLVPFDCQGLANRVSCDQDIAADGYFSLGMIARTSPALEEHGEWFYRRLFWECGVIGQVLYLEAEAAGARATGIGCYYDDPVHDVLGLSGDRWQSFYHLAMGRPIEDARLTTEPGYTWETPGSR